MDILFNSKTPEFSWLSNFSPHSVGRQPTAEHAYQASKFTDATLHAYFRTCPTPAQVKKLGAVTQSIYRRHDWEDVKQHVMWKILTRKFTDHAELKWALIGTYPHPLYHLAPWDTYWGVDGSMGGDNHMGEILMEVRDELRRSTS